MNYCKQLRFAGGFESRFEPFRLDDASPFGFHFMHSSAEPPGRVREPITKRANRPDYDVVAFFDQVDQCSFHPRRPGPGHGKGDFIGGLKDETEQLLDVVHHAYEGGVEMADHRREHCLHYAWMNTGWTRPQKNARRRLQFWKRNRHYRVSVYASASRSMRHAARHLNLTAYYDPAGSTRETPFALARGRRISVKTRRVALKLPKLRRRSRAMD